jgi:hypothetical protein
MLPLAAYRRLYFIQFCSSCSDVGDHVPCAVDGCPVYMCVGEVEGTSCLRTSEYEGDSWYCPGHNVPSKIKVVRGIHYEYLCSNYVSKYDILSQNTRQLDFHRTLVPFLYLRINLTSSVRPSDRDSIKRHLVDMYGIRYRHLVCAYLLSRRTIDFIIFPAMHLVLRVSGRGFSSGDAGFGGELDSENPSNRRLGRLGRGRAC